MAQPLLNITSSNATAVLVVNELFPQGVVLQNFGTDQSISSEAITVAETRMGVDGGMAAGYTPSSYSVTLSLEANSPSLAELQDLLNAMTVNQTIYDCTLTVSIPSLSQVHIWSHGVLTSGKPLADLKKILDPTQWTFVFQDYSVVPY